WGCRSAMDDIFERAARLGLETEYWNAFGELRAVRPDVLARLVDALAPANEGVGERILPRSIVVRDEEAVLLSGAGDRPSRWQLFADGKIAEGEAAPIVLPRGLGQGVFRLHVAAGTAAGDASEDASLIRSPAHAYQGDAAAPRRMWALAVQLYGIRSR